MKNAGKADFTIAFRIGESYLITLLIYFIPIIYFYTYFLIITILFRDPSGNCKCIPDFMPISLLCTCCLIGQIETKMTGENEICCEMGVKGAACCCLFSTVFYGPPGFILYNCRLRKKVIKKYNVSPSESTCHQEWCYPCSYFQMLVSLQEWDNERRASEIHSNK